MTLRALPITPCIFIIPVLDLSDYTYWPYHYSFELYAHNFTLILKKIEVLHRPNCYSWYVDSLCPFWSKNLNPFQPFHLIPKIYDLAQWASNYPYLFLFGRTAISILYHTMTFEVLILFHLNPPGNIYDFSTFILNDSILFFHRQIWFPTTWEVSNHKGLRDFLSFMVLELQLRNKTEPIYSYIQYDINGFTNSHTEIFNIPLLDLILCIV